MVVVAIAVLFAGASAADGNEPPLAEAGLDQTVDNGTTVYLDAGGSVDPDGSLATVSWEITGPNGATVDTADDASVRTQFTPSETGNYTVNLTVTDDDGATRTDTLYVTVEESSGPSVGILGPGETTPDSQTSFVVNASAGSANLSQLYWIENGSVERTVDLSGENETVTINHSFSETKPYRLNATVLDMKGYSQTTSRLVYVDSSTVLGGYSDYEHCPDGGSPYFGFDGEFIGCTGEGDADMIYEDRVLEQNGEEGLDLYDNTAGRIVQMMTPRQVETFEESSNGAPTRNLVTQSNLNSFENSYDDSFNGWGSDSSSLGFGSDESSSESSDGDESSDDDSGETSLPPIEPASPPPSTQRYMN
ncbi:PKD domain-containing protein [Halobacteria archaeon HArc-gm2]|nr:PKD domain-containing protein [Halobacteria archaeon HArc-gm2]